jgi:hypothetical protein
MGRTVGEKIFIYGIPQKNVLFLLFLKLTQETIDLLLPHCLRSRKLLRNAL